MLPNKKTAKIITNGWSLTASEKIIGTNIFPSMNWSNKYKPINNSGNGFFGFVGLLIFFAIILTLQY